MLRRSRTMLVALVVLAPLPLRADEKPRVYPDSGGRLVWDRVRFLPAPGHERDMVGGKFTGSNVSATEGFEVLAEIRAAPPAGEWTELSFDGKRPHRWVRYEAPPGSFGHINKLEFFAGERRLGGPGFGSIGRKQGGRDWPRVFDKDNLKVWFESDTPDGQYVGIDVGDAATAVRPQMEPPPGEQKGPVRVTLQSPTPGTIVRYTLDGTLPGAGGGQLYKEPIAVEKTTTLVAVSFKEGFAPSPPSQGTYLVGPSARPALSTFHIGNSLTGTTGRFAMYAQTAGFDHTDVRYLQPGIWTSALWETDVLTTKERWEKTFASLTKVNHFTVQPRDPDIAHEAKYEILFFDLLRTKFPDMQPWLYAEWTSRERNRPWDQGTIPSPQMKVFPALTWEESAANMLVYMEDLQQKVLKTYKGGKRPRVLPSVLAAGWIKNLLDRGQVPGLCPKDFDPIMFFDCVHPGPDGAYLIDLTWYAAFYRESPEGKVLPVGTALTTEQSTVMQRLAWDVVKNYPDCGLFEEGTSSVGQPQFSLAPGKISAPTRVTLSSATPGAWFRYTLDGTEPTRTRGYVYCGVISVQPGMTLKALAYKSGMADSPVSAAIYPSPPPPVRQDSRAVPKLGMGPPSYDKGKCFRELFEKPEAWKETRSAIDMLMCADHNLNRNYTDEELRAWFAQLRQWKLKLELEVGAVKPWGITGEKTFNTNRPIWERVQRLGGEIDSIALDEPLLCCRLHIHQPDDYAVRETAHFIALVRRHFPQVRIGDIETYPSIPLADHFGWIESLDKRLAELGVRGLDFYRLDVNWAEFVVFDRGSWPEVKKLERYCRQRQLPFSLIYWASGYPALKKQGLADDSTWYVSIMRQGYDYALAQGAPDQYVVQSWIDGPARSTPETEPFTFTRSVLDFSRKFVQRKPN